MGVGDGDGECVGGVGAVGGRARQEAPHHGADLALVAMACADHGLLDGVGRISAMMIPESAGTSRAIPRAWPSLSVAEASRLTKVARSRPPPAQAPRAL